MKVLQVITSLSTGGAEKLILDTVPLYQEEGIHMDVLSLKDKKTEFWKELDNKTSDDIFGLTQGSVYNPLLIFKIIPYLKKYDIIHIHLFPALYWVVLAKWLSFSRTKLFYTEHNTENRRRDHPLLKIFDRLIYKGLYEIITISEKVDVQIKKHLKSTSSQRFKLIQNGIPVSDFVNALPLDKNSFFSENDFLLIQVSSFRKQKDQKTLICSLLSLPNNVKLILVGDGVLKKEQEALVKELNLQSRVKFLGIRSDIPNLLKTANVVVLSSYHEGLSLSSIEGMAAKPFIASNVPGLKEIVKGYGLLFERGNDKELAALIMKLYEDQEFYNKISNRCLKRAKEFDIHKMVDRYIKEYKKANKPGL